MFNIVIRYLKLCSINILLINYLFSISPEACSKNFVYLSDIDPTIIQSPRYCSSENFVGCCVDGYKKPVIMLTKQAAIALKNVQADVKKDGYSLVVYDAYRPQCAVNHFMRWGKDINDQSKKLEYYPRVEKKDVIDFGYVAKKSGHSRGSTVDLTLIKIDKKLKPITESKRKLTDGFTISFLDDNTLDMGSSFDLFDKASHYENDLISADHKKLRTYLKNIMEKHGFQIATKEWWHFTLKNEPYPADKDSSYFNFPIE